MNGTMLAELKGLNWLSREKCDELANQLAVSRLKDRARVLITAEESSEAYLVLRGLVQVAEPRRALSTIVGPGEIFGLCGLVFGQPTSFSFRTCTDSRIGQIDPENFVRIVFGVPTATVRPALDFVFKRWWGGTLRKAFTPTGLSVEHRLNRALHELGAKIGLRDSRGTILDAAISHQALSELIGASRPKTTEAFGRLICSGKVICDRRRIILVDEHCTTPRRARPNLRLRKSG